VSDELVTLAHGNGGRRTRRLVEEIFARHFGRSLDTTVDAALIRPGSETLAFTTDGFSVQPLEFPGGDIGSLAVHGSVNDLAVSGARPTHLSCAALIEEGLPLATLDRLIRSMARAARDAGVEIVAGDTKVVPQGHGGGLYLTTAGIGRVVRTGLGLAAIEPGDQILCSGPVGDHGVTVLLAREAFDLRGDLRSDCASVLPLAEKAWALAGVRFLRDPTRGGLATVAHEIAAGRGVDVVLEEGAIPIRDGVAEFCRILGFDPLYLACEGRIVAVCEPRAALQLLSRWRELPGGVDAALIGEITRPRQPASPRVSATTEIGGTRVIPELEDDPLPRIC
jgi:hydrogenase expression/formation protein HypE